MDTASPGALLGSTASHPSEMNSTLNGVDLAANEKKDKKRKSNVDFRRNISLQII